MNQHRFHTTAKTLSLSLVAAAALAAGNSAQAALAFILTETGSGVTLVGSGSFNFGGSLITGGGFLIPTLAPAVAAFSVGPIAPSAYLELDAFTGPSGFGSGSPAFATGGSGQGFGFDADAGFVNLPVGYVSGAALGGGTSFWSGETLASLGATPGSYTWNTTFGGVNDTITLDVIAVPEPAAAGLSLLALGLLARRRRK